MKRAFLLLLLPALCLAAPAVRAEDAAEAKRREAEALVKAERWDDAASAYLEVAGAKGPGWEADARNAQACAARASASRGATAMARTAYEIVLREDPGNAVAKAGLSALAREAGPAPAPRPEPLPPPAPKPAAPAPKPVPAATPTPLPPPSPSAIQGAESLYREAMAQGREGRLLTAREKLRQALRLNPDHPEAWKAVSEVDKALVDQVERSFHRHDRPAPSPFPEERIPKPLPPPPVVAELPAPKPVPVPAAAPPAPRPAVPVRSPWLAAHLPSSPPPVLDAAPEPTPSSDQPPGTLEDGIKCFDSCLAEGKLDDAEAVLATLAKYFPAEEKTLNAARQSLAEARKADTQPDKARCADLLHARAQALTLLKSEAFDQARAAFEAIRAAHPEAKARIEADLKDLEEARRKAEAAHQAEAEAAAAEAASRARAQTEAQQAAREARAKDLYASALALRDQGDLQGALVMFRTLERFSPAYQKTREYLEELPKALEKSEAEARARGRSEALSAAHRDLETGRYAEARRDLTPLFEGVSPDAEVTALLEQIAEAQSRHDAEAAQAAAQARLKARRDAIEAAVQLASHGDPRGARVQLYQLRSQEPGDPEATRALGRVDELEREAARPPLSTSVPPEPPAPPPPASPEQAVARRRAEAAQRLHDQAEAEACDREFETARDLYFGGELEEARRRFVHVAELAPGSRGVDRYLSKIDEALKDREALGMAASQPPEPGPAAAAPAETPHPATPPAPPPPESLEDRYRRAMDLYERSDLIPAEPLLRQLAEEPDLGWWKKRRVTKALEDVVRRREKARAALNTEAARAADDREAQALRDIAYYLDTGRPDDARRALDALMAGPVSDEGRKQATALKARLEAPPGR